MGVEGTTLAGRYRLERLLAEGGMGQVWAARHLTLDIPVAVKLMSGAATLRSALRSRFELEAKAIAQLRSPNIVQIFDYGTEDETPFIVMELLAGSDLLSLIPRRPRWPLAEIADIVTQVGKGLSAAHARGIIHRDIKPGNVFLSRSGNDTIIKLLDFGIAKWLASDQNLTETGAVLGSPYYMAPEQVRGDALDFRADLWALSVVAYRLATGALPFEGRDALEVAECVMVGKWNPVVVPTPKARELQRFFEKAFAADRNDRFASAAELTEKLILITGPPMAAWSGERESTAGENTVTMLRPRLSQPEAIADEISLTDVGISLMPNTDPEGEVVTNRVDQKPPDPTTQRMRQAPLDELSAHLAKVEAVPHVPFRAPETSASQLQQMHELQQARPVHGAPPNGHWGLGWAADPSDTVVTGRYRHRNQERQSNVATGEWQMTRSRPSAVVISLSLCATLVAGIGIWIAVNVLSSHGSDAQEASAHAATSEPAKASAASQPPSRTAPSATQAPSSSLTATPSASASAPSVVVPSGPKPKGGSGPSWMHHP